MNIIDILLTGAYWLGMIVLFSILWVAAWGVILGVWLRFVNRLCPFNLWHCNQRRTIK